MSNDDNRHSDEVEDSELVQKRKGCSFFFSFFAPAAYILRHRRQINNLE